jgi:quercetin dioxygenase-like cupin family protein
MSGYTMKNLKDVEDQAARHGMSPAVEARFARDELECEQVAVSYQRLAPGVRQPFGHRHRTHEELYVVTGGGGRVKVDEDIVELGPLDVVRVAPGSVRAFEGGPDGIELLAFGPYGTTDGELVPEWWTD